MDKYTCKNLIIDPETQGLEDIIGKEVYFSDVPLSCITWANNHCEAGILKGICKDSDFPFQIETPEKVVQDFACIIPKREEPKPKYVPFESKEEFIEAFHYHDNDKYSETDDILLNYGMWLKLNELYVLVTCISDEYIKTFESCYFWNELLENFEFLDGSPCGKESGDE